MLKRTGFRRKVIEHHSPPIKPVERQYAAGSFDAVRASPKTVMVRDEAYRRYVAAKPCYRCGVAGYSQAAHPNVDKGLGLKTDDRLCFPLCSDRPMVLGCHGGFDQARGIARQERREREAGYVARARDEAALDGWTL